MFLETTAWDISLFFSWIENINWPKDWMGELFQRSWSLLWRYIRKRLLNWWAANFYLHSPANKTKLLCAYYAQIKRPDNQWHWRFWLSGPLAINGPHHCHLAKFLAHKLLLQHLPSHCFHGRSLAKYAGQVWQKGGCHRFCCWGQQN